MKNIARLLITAVLSALFVQYAYAEELKVYDVEDVNVLEAIEVLDNFGLVKIHKDNSFRGFEKITRRDMAEMINDMLGNELGFTSNYRDVKDDDPAYDAIGFASSRNIMVGNGEGRFRPDDFINCAEAIKTMVSVLGFDEKAKLAGGYPNGYIQVASELDLPTSFNMDEYITKNELVLLLYAAYHAPVYVMKLEDGKQVYTIDEDITLLSYYHNINKYNGIVTGTYLSKLNNADSGLKKGQIEIDGYVFDTSLDNSDEFFGCYVEYYLREDGDEAEVVSIRENNKNQQITALSEDILPSTNRNQLAADVNGRDKIYKICENADFIYNREADPAFDGENMIPQNGLIRIVDNNGDDIFDVVFIEDYETVVVDYVSTSNLTVVDKYGASLKLSEEEYEYIEYEYDGTEAQFSDITAGDILSVLKSRQKASVLVKINRENVLGVVSLYAEDYIKLDNGSEILISPALEAAWTAGDIIKPKAGVQTTIYFDVFSKAAYTLSSSISGYGYLRKIYVDETIEDEATLRILSVETEQWETYKCKKNLKINGTKQKILSNLKQELSEKQMIRYKVNAYGEITSIETASEYTIPGNDTEIVQDKFRATSKGSRMYRTQNSSWNSQFYMDQNTKILYIPTSAEYADRENYYTFKAASAFSADVSYNVQGFDYDNEYFVKLLVHYGSGGSSEDVSGSSLCIVDKIYEALNEDDEVVKNLHCVMQGKEYSFYTSDISNNLLEGIKKGDVLQLGFDEDGKISTVSKTYTYDPSNFTTNANVIGDYHSKRVIVMADVVDVNTRTIRIKTAARDYVFKRSGSVAIFDAKENKIISGTFEDIEAGDYVVMRYRESSLRDTIVYRR